MTETFHSMSNRFQVVVNVGGRNIYFNQYTKKNINQNVSFFNFIITVYVILVKNIATF